MNRIITILLFVLTAFLASAQDVSKTIEIKSVYAKSVTTVMGQKIITVSFFDDFGAKTISTVETPVPGMGTVKVSTITKDGKCYIINYAAKKIQEMPIPESVNYLNLTEEAISKYKIHNVGKEIILDRECIKYTEEVSSMGQTAKVTAWVYKGIPLKTVTEAQGMEVVMEVMEFNENAVILPQTFDVPVF